VAAAYVGIMCSSGILARRIAMREFQALKPGPISAIMAAPVLVNPLMRSIVARQADAYRTATFHWLTSPHIDAATIRDYPAQRPTHPAIATATASEAARRFLGWARFPTFSIDSGQAGFVVHIVDLRYATAPGARFGAVSVPVQMR